MLYLRLVSACRKRFVAPERSAGSCRGMRAALAELLYQSPHGAHDGSARSLRRASDDRPILHFPTQRGVRGGVITHTISPCREISEAQNIDLPCLLTWVVPPDAGRTDDGGQQFQNPQESTSGSAVARILAAHGVADRADYYSLL